MCKLIGSLGTTETIFKAGRAISTTEIVIGLEKQNAIEYATQASFPTTGESDVIYIDASTDSLFRWNGSAYASVGGGGGGGSSNGWLAISENNDLCVCISAYYCVRCT